MRLVGRLLAALPVVESGWWFGHRLSPRYGVGTRCPAGLGSRRAEIRRRRHAPRTVAMLRGGRGLRVVACLSVLLVVAGTTATSGAKYIRGTRNPSNTFAAGSLRLINSRDATFVLSTGALRPGQSSTGTLTLTDQGDFAGAFTITNAGISDTPVSPSLSAALTLMIEDITGTAQTLWTGTMSTFSSLALAQFSAGQVRTYRFTVTFPQASAVPGLQAAASVMTLRFVGVAK